MDIWFGDGTGGFPRMHDLNPPDSTYDFAAADMEGDGDPDLFGATGGSAFSMLNNGDGSFAPGKTSWDMRGIGLTLNHFDGDGLLDLAVASASEQSANIGLRNPDGTFSKTDEYGDLAQQAEALASGDVTGDGLVHLITNGDTHTTNLLPAGGTGRSAVPRCSSPG
jgi:hypothetical protein